MHRPSLNLSALSLAALLTLSGTALVQPQELEVGALHGVVLDAWGEPVAGVIVQLTEGDCHGHDDWKGYEPPITVTRDGVEEEVILRYRDSEILTDDDGAYAFPDLAPSTYAVRVLANRWTRIDRITEVPAGEPAELEIELPLLGSAAFRILLPEGELSSRMALKVRLDNPGQLTPIPHNTEALQLEDDGTVVLEGLPLGAHFFSLRVNDFDRPDDHWPFMDWSHYLGKFAVETIDDPVRVLYLEDSFPVLGGVSIAWNEATRWSRGHLQIANLGPNQAVEEFESTHNADRMLFRVPPGSYRVVVEDRFNGWKWVDPTSFDVQRGERAEVEVEVPFEKRTIRIFTPDGDPFADQEITWRPAGKRSPKKITLRRRTDVDGRVEKLWLPPGDYIFGAAEVLGVEAAVTWVADDVDLVIELEDPE